MTRLVRTYKFLGILAFLCFALVWYFTIGYGQLFAPKAKGVVKQWATGANGNWNVAANWEPSGIPTATDDVDLTTTTGSYVITIPDGYTAEFASFNANSGQGLNVRLIMSGDISTNGNVTFGSSSTFTLATSSPISIGGNLTVESGGDIQTDGTVTNIVHLTAANIDIQAGGEVDVDGLGHAGGTFTNNGDGPGGGIYGSEDAGSGGGHGGLGGKDATAASPGGGGYCDITAPTTAGSGGGGGGNQTGGSGGGIIQLVTAGSLTIDGTITSNGDNGGTESSRDAGGGAGGSVFLLASTTVGTAGTVRANGGNSGNGNDSGGGGAGGCVKLQFNTNSFPITSIQAYGGTGNQYGGAGQIYIKNDVLSDDDLYIINDGNNGTTPADTQQIAASLTMDSLTLASSSVYAVTSTNALTLNDADPLTGGNTSGTLRIDNTATFTPPAAFTLSNATLEFTEGATWTASSTSDLTIGSNGTLDLRNFTTTTGLTLDDFTINSGGTGTHGANTTAQTHVFHISATTTNILAGGTIDVDGKGYTGGSTTNDGNGPGPGQFGPIESGSGGGHAGAGGSNEQNTAGGSAYCVTNNPGTIGSGGGGGGNVSGGAGGGLIKLDMSSTLVVAGTLTADGAVGGDEAGRDGGGGGGGAVYLSGTMLTLNGSTITLDGGNAANGDNSGGGGGGGCFYALYDTYSDDTATTSTAAGTGQTSAGSVAVAGTWTLAVNNNAPSVTAFTALAITDGTGLVRISTTTVSDADDDAVTLIVDYSIDNGTTWASSSIREASADAGGTPATSTGSIGPISIATSNNVSFEWHSRNDSVVTSTEVWIRISPNDGTEYGTAVTSTLAFEVDNEDPTVPENLTIFNTSTTSVIFGLGTTSTDSNFLEYKIFYKQGASGVTESDTAYTSTTDANFGDSNFNSAVVSTSIGGLSVNTQYVAALYAYDSFGNSTSTAGEISFYTLASAHGTPTVATPGITDMQINFVDTLNSTTTELSIYNITDAQYVNAFGLSSATPVWQTTSTWDLNFEISGLSTSTPYQFEIVARNGDGIPTVSSSASLPLYTLAETPGTPTIGSVATTTMPITIAPKGNSTSTEYAIYNTSDDNFLSATGASTASPVYQTTSTWGTSFAAIGLNTSTPYTFEVLARNGDQVLTASSTVSAGTYTLAEAAGAATISSPTLTTLQIALDDVGNSTSTSYAVYSLTDSAYVGANGVSSTTAVFMTTSTWATVSSTSLTANTSYSYEVVARNGDSVDAPSSTASTGVFTLANVPSLGSVSSNGDQITVSFSGDATQYSVESTSGGLSSGWISGSSYDFTSLDCGQTYTFRIKGQNGDAVETGYSGTDTGETAGCGGGAAAAATVTKTVKKTVEKVEKVKEEVKEKVVEVKKKVTDVVKKIFSKNKTSAPATGNTAGAGGASGGASGGGSAGGSSGGQASAPPTIDAAVSLAKEGRVVEATNSRQVDIVLETGFSKVTLLDDAGNILENIDINPIIPWQLAAGDGEKCVTAVFYDALGNEAGRKVTCVNLDTTPPRAPFIQNAQTKIALTDISTGRLVTVRGTSEPNIGILISAVRTGDISESDLSVNINPFHIYTVHAAGTQTFRTQSDDKGFWSFTFPESFDVGKYSISVQAEDKAGNVSEPATAQISVLPKNIAKVIKAVIDNPEVERINETIVAPAVIAVGGANVVATGFQLPQVFMFLKYLFLQPVLLFRRRKHKGWGTVYDGFTKKPVDLASVRFVDAKTGAIRRSQVTDVQGRYFLMADPGSYKIEVDKHGFGGISKHLEGIETDGDYARVYHGEELTISEGQTEINYSVPIDPEGKEVPAPKLIRKSIVRAVQHIISIVGMGSTFLSFVISPTPTIGGFLVLHVGFYALSHRFSKSKLPDSFGVVYDDKKEALRRVVIRVFDSAYNKLVDTQLTDAKGRYALLVGPSKYYVTYEKPGYEKKQTKEMDFSKEHGGMITTDERLRRSGKPMSKKEKEAFEKEQKEMRDAAKESIAKRKAEGEAGEATGEHVDPEKLIAQWKQDHGQTQDDGVQSQE